MEFIRKNNCFSSYLSLFLLGTILLFFRSAYSFITPYLYAEDGIWIFQIINDGFLHTFVNQRYFMTGYLILEEISIWINKLLFGYNLRYLPDVISVVSYSFHSAVALMAFICLKQNLRTFPRYLMWLMILLMPTGNTGFEIFGRIMNYGYMFFFIAFILVFYLIFNVSADTNKFKLAVIALILWICSTTNAASNIMLAVGFFMDIALQLSAKRREHSGCCSKWIYLKDLFGAFKNRLWLLLGIVCLICFLYQAFAMQLISDGSILHAPNPENNIAFFGRSILYYFTWPFYKNLNDGYVILMLVLFAMVSILAIIVSEKRIQTFYLFAGTLMIAIATFCMRPGLTFYLQGYQSTFPDRYYYVINLCAMVTIIYAGNCLNKCPALIFCKYYIYALLIFPILYSPSAIFEFDKHIGFDTFYTQVWHGQKQPDGSYRVNTNPKNWGITANENYVFSTMANVRDYSTLESAKKFYTLLNDDTLHIAYDGDEDSIWFAIWSKYNGQDDLVWVRASSECKSGKLCYDLKLSAAKLLESPYYIHIYKGKEKPEKFLGALTTPER